MFDGVAAPHRADEARRPEPDRRGPPVATTLLVAAVALACVLLLLTDMPDATAAYQQAGLLF